MAQPQSPLKHLSENLILVLRLSHRKGVDELRPTDASGLFVPPCCDVLS
jgi:hypothetical protein